MVRETSANPAFFPGKAAWEGTFERAVHRTGRAAAADDFLNGDGASIEHYVGRIRENHGVYAQDGALWYRTEIAGRTRPFGGDASRLCWQDSRTADPRSHGIQMLGHYESKLASGDLSCSECSTRFGWLIIGMFREKS